MAWHLYTCTTPGTSTYTGTQVVAWATLGNSGQCTATQPCSVNCHLSQWGLSPVAVSMSIKAVIHSVVRQTWSSSLQLELNNTQPIIWSWSIKSHSLPKTHMIHDLCYVVRQQSFRIFLWSHPIIFANVISKCSIYDYINKHVKQLTFRSAIVIMFHQWDVKDTQSQCALMPWFWIQLKLTYKCSLYIALHTMHCIVQHPCNLLETWHMQLSVLCSPNVETM